MTLDFASIGDWVNFTIVSENIGVIEGINSRKNYLSRKAIKAKGSLKRGVRMEQIIASNIDNLFIVNSIRSPMFNNRFIDRVIVSAESSNINVIIVINKVDLDDKNLVKHWEHFYSKVGYKVLVASATKNIGISEIRESLQNNVNLFWGQSGVGKSTLLNTLYPYLEFEVGEISESSEKGTHTTVTGEMREVGEDTFIIDTPGIREIDPYGIEKKDLSHYFNEFIPFIHECKFRTCIHEHEPGCAIINAVEHGEITLERYQSYLNLLNSIEDDMIY